MTAQFVSRWLMALGLASAAALGFACTVNPATGERQLTLVGEQQEVQMGLEADKSVQQSMGLYSDDGWQDYLQNLGKELAAHSERPDLPWTFRVIDDPVVNAFALPGGFIYVTRGILTHFNSEAELVSVLGHEIGHVTGRHGVERMSKAQLATLGLGVATIAGGREYGGLVDLAGQGLGVLFLKFSRDDERQADDLGLRYLTRGGYDPSQMPLVFETLERVSASQGGGRLPAWLSTHPDPGNRAQRIRDGIAKLPPEKRRGEVDRAEYLNRLDGMTYGVNPREGYSIDNVFYHPDLKFKLTFPEGWNVVNQRQAVGAISSQQDAVVVLSLASESGAGRAAEKFFSQQGVERGDGWRRDGYYYFRTTPTQGRPTIVGLAGFFDYGGNTYQLLGYTTDDKWSGRGRAIENAVGSFRRLTERRYLDVQPKKIDVVKLPSAMDLEEFDRRYPSTVDLAELAILNGVDSSARLPAGTLVKRVVGGKLPK